MKTETPGNTRRGFWVGLGLSATGGAWLMLAALAGYSQLARAEGRLALSPVIVAQLICAIAMIVCGFAAMAGASSFVDGMAVDFEDRGDRDSETARKADDEFEPQAVGAAENVALRDESAVYGPLKPVIMIRCRRCETLNSENRVTCISCDHPI